AYNPHEDLDLPLAHRLLDEGQRLVVTLGARSQAEAPDGRGEGGDDGAVVGDGGARHVQAGHGDTGHAKVSSAIAGAQVMPRPPGPVTRMTPGATWDRWYSSPVVTWLYTPAQRRWVGGSAAPSSRPARPRRWS